MSSLRTTQRSIRTRGFIEPDDARIAHLTNPDRGVAKDAFFLGVTRLLFQRNHPEYGGPDGHPPPGIIKGALCPAHQN